MNEIEYIVIKWEKEEKENPNNMRKIINETIKKLYISNQSDVVHSIFNSIWSKYIDTTYDNGSIIEFASLTKHNKNKKSIIDIKYIIEYIISKKEDNTLLYTKAIHNVLLSAVSKNNKQLIEYITKEQQLIKINFEYENYAIIKNCLSQSKQNNIKEEILYNFITKCELKKTNEIKKIFKKYKKEDILKLFDKIEIYEKLSNNLKIKNDNNKKLKI